MNQEKDELFKLLKEWNITKDLDKCEEIVMEALEKSLLNPFSAAGGRFNFERLSCTDFKAVLI